MGCEGLGDIYNMWARIKRQKLQIYITNLKCDFKAGLFKKTENL